MRQAVFVPGLLCTGELFESQKAALGDALDITVADHRGHDSFSAIAQAILDTAPQKFICAGLSMGGYAAFEIVRAAPERVEALILMNTSARGETPEQTERRKGHMELAQAQGLDAVVGQMLPMLVAEHHLGRDDITGTFRRMAHDTGVEGFLNQEKAIMGRADSRSALATISCPVLVIVGDADMLTPPELAQEIADGIPNATLGIIEKCGHLSTIEQPGAVNAAIRSFLEDAGLAG